MTRLWTDAATTTLITLSCLFVGRRTQTHKVTVTTNGQEGPFVNPIEIGMNPFNVGFLAATWQLAPDCYVAMAARKHANALTMAPSSSKGACRRSELSLLQAFSAMVLSTAGGSSSMWVVSNRSRCVALAASEYSCDYAEVEASVAVQNHAIPAETRVRPHIVAMLRQRQFTETA